MIDSKEIENQTQNEKENKDKNKNKNTNPSPSSNEEKEDSWVKVSTVHLEDVKPEPTKKRKDIGCRGCQRR